MRPSLKDQFNDKKTQYSSRILMPSTGTNFNNSQSHINRGVSAEISKRNNLSPANSDSHNLSNIITQVPKQTSSRPQTSKYEQISPRNNPITSQDAKYNILLIFSSPKPNSERIAYSLSPSKTINK